MVKLQESDDDVSNNSKDVNNSNILQRQIEKK